MSTQYCNIQDRGITSLCFNFFQSGKSFSKTASGKQGCAIGKQRPLWLQVCIIWAREFKLCRLHQLRRLGWPPGSAALLGGCSTIFSSYLSCRKAKPDLTAKLHKG